MKKIIGYFLVGAFGGIAAVTVNHFFSGSTNACFTSADIKQPIGKYASMPVASPKTAIDFTSAANTSVHAVVHVKTVFESENNTYYTVIPLIPTDFQLVTILFFDILS